MLIKNVRLSYPHIWKPEAHPRNPTDLKYSAISLLYEGHPQMQEVKDEIIRVAQETWPNGLPPKLEVCLRPTSEKSNRDGYQQPGYFFNAKNKNRPTVWDRDGRTPLVEADGRPYGGCYVNIMVEFWADKENQAVYASLRGLQFAEDGEAFGGTAPVGEGEFPDLGGAPAAPGFAPTQHTETAPTAPTQPAPAHVEQKSVGASLFG